MSTSFEWLGHHKLLRYLIIKAKVTNIEPLRVGAATVTSMFEPVDQVVLKVYDLRRGNYVPVIPGSSWKGVIKAHAYRLCLTYGLNVCSGIPGESHVDSPRILQQLDNYDVSSKLRFIIDGDVKLCILDLIFGAPGLLSHVVIKDSLPINEPKLGYRTMVAINRRTGSSARTALFSVEYVEPGCEFEFELICKNLPNYAVGLIAEVIKDINEGIVKVGGLKSRGFGRVEFKGLSIKVREFGGTPLRALDPIDQEIKLGKDEVSGSEAWGLLNELIKVWHNSLEKLRKVSEANWRWGVILE